MKWLGFCGTNLSWIKKFVNPSLTCAKRVLKTVIVTCLSLFTWDLSLGARTTMGSVREPSNLWDLSGQKYAIPSSQSRKSFFILA